MLQVEGMLAVHFPWLLHYSINYYLVRSFKDCLGVGGFFVCFCCFDDLDVVLFPSTCRILLES